MGKVGSPYRTRTQSNSFYGLFETPISLFALPPVQLLLVTHLAPHIHTYVPTFIHCIAISYQYTKYSYQCTLNIQPCTHLDYTYIHILMYIIHTSDKCMMYIEIDILIYAYTYIYNLYMICTHWYVFHSFRWLLSDCYVFYAPSKSKTYHISLNQ